MKALLIEVDFRTGKRAGDIDPRDPGLPCRGWQNLDVKPGIEIRLINDDRDASQYEDIPGVTVLGEDAINRAISDNVPTRYVIQDMTFVLAQLQEKGVKLSEEFAGKTIDEVAKKAYGMRLGGVIEIKPEQV